MDETDIEGEELYICVECGYEGTEGDFCPDCGGQMLPKEEAEDVILGESEEEEDL